MAPSSAFSNSVILGISLLLTSLRCVCCASVPALNETEGLNVTGSFYPDFIQCRSNYGDDLHALPCEAALKKVFPGFIPKYLTITRQAKKSSELQAPLVYKDDDTRPGCVITVDLSGNSITQISKSLWSGELRQMAKNVVSNCVTYNHQGIGGFETYGIEKTGLYMAKTVPVTNGINSPLFLTLSVTNLQKANLKPGDTDPRVDEELTTVLRRIRFETVMPSARNKISLVINQLQVILQTMTPGSQTTWWDFPHFVLAVPSDINYRCSATFGKPSNAACQMASFNFIDKGDPAPTISPGNPLSFESGNCVMQVQSQRAAVTVPWDTLRGAADLLLTECIDETPGPAPYTGGQAVYKKGSGSGSKAYPWPNYLVMSMVEKGTPPEPQPSAGNELPGQTPGSQAAVGTDATS